MPPETDRQDVGGSTKNTNQLLPQSIKTNFVSRFPEIQLKSGHELGKSVESRMFGCGEISNALPENKTKL